MVDATIRHELSDCLSRMTLEEQRRVLKFAQDLSDRLPPGVTGESLLEFAGKIEAADLDAMSRAIKSECEKVDADEW